MVRLGSGFSIGLDPAQQRALVAIARHTAQHVVQRHESKAESEAAERYCEQLEGQAPVRGRFAGHDVARMTDMTMKPK